MLTLFFDPQDNFCVYVCKLGGHWWSTSQPIGQIQYNAPDRISFFRRDQGEVRETIFSIKDIERIESVIQQDGKISLALVLKDGSKTGLSDFFGKPHEFFLSKERLQVETRMNHGAKPYRVDELLAYLCQVPLQKDGSMAEIDEKDCENALGLEDMRNPLFGKKIRI